VPTYLRLLRFLNDESTGPKLRIVVASLLSGLARGAMLAAFNAAAARGAQGAQPMLALAFLAALAIYLATSYDSSFQRDLLVATMVRTLRLRLCEKLLFARLRFLESHNLGEVYAQIGQDINRLAVAATSALSALQTGVLVLFAFAYLGRISTIGLLAAIVTVVAGAAIYYWQERRATGLIAQARRFETKFYNALGDVLWGYKELRLRRSRHGDLWTHLTDVTARSRDLDVEEKRLSMVSGLTTETFNFALIATLVFLLPSLIAGGTSSVFQFLATIFYVIGPIESLVSAFPTFSRARHALRNLEALERDLGGGLEEHRAPAATAPEFHHLALEGIAYRFEGDSADQRFDMGPVDLELRRGEIVMMIGGNGAGKTTLLKLLTGLYPPLSGRIVLNQRPLQPDGLQPYREMFAAVFSDFHLFKQLYGVEEFDAGAFEALLAELQIAHKTRLDNGAFTNLTLSTGQRKRLCYAVERISERQIYVFDEFASDQDASFRRYFYRELLPALKRQGKTVVAVTHDERWFDVADRVIKLEYGRIVEVRTGAELAASVAEGGPA
jgi:putative pyoverdin transport system ATP-binding/permease protein